MGNCLCCDPYVEFEDGEPVFKTDEILDDDEEGVLEDADDEGSDLIVIVRGKKNQIMAFYNDTECQAITVRAIFSRRCDVHALGNTVLEYQKSGAVAATVTVYPCETEMFVEGRLGGCALYTRSEKMLDEDFDSLESSDCDSISRLYR